MRNNEILDDFEFEEPSFDWEHQDNEVIGKFYSGMEAEVAAARLRSEGIPCFVANGTAQSVMTHIPIYVRLHVRPMDAEQARTILAEAAIDAGTENQPKSDNTLVYGLVAAIVIIVVYFFWIAFGGNK